MEGLVNYYCLIYVIVLLEKIGKKSTYRWSYTCPSFIVFNLNNEFLTKSLPYIYIFNITNMLLHEWSDVIRVHQNFEELWQSNTWKPTGKLIIVNIFSELERNNVSEEAQILFRFNDEMCATTEKTIHYWGLYNMAYV